MRLDAPLLGDNGAVALWFHGQGGDVDERMDGQWLNSLRERGWSVASGDLNRGNWGNPASVEAARNLANWASELSGKPVKLVVAGSMGGLVSLNAIKAGAVSTPCWYGIMPVVDIDAVGGVPGAAIQIESAYGGVPPASSNPASSPLPENISYRIVASPGDIQVPKATNGDRIRDLVSNPAVVSELSVTGDHGDLSHFNAADLDAFASKCAH
ncbi:MAG: hypothetical protein U5O16_00265 [Rhodococcus sp. (in: high G+C Gram-positive bacteria)]|uniref:hypothetical protein n=1 Tax=Rhodococcus sp. TaxID=1831 RepID=UPI002AD7F6B3|nr:hypothetical protein [Rhodococcus sp. (in: high G+C Gram-positive bacteria)]